MRKLLLMVILITTFFSETYAVPAYPFPIKYKQPDGSEITIKLKGDERVHWAETSDGYTLLSNGKNGWEYAMADQSGNIKASGVLAREASKRTLTEAKLIRGLSRNLRFSQKQVNLLKSAWEAKNGSDKLIGTSDFFRPNAIKSSTNDGRQKVFSPNGTKKLLMILIQFPDLPFTYTKNDFIALMNTQNYNLNGAKGSVRDYFREQSYWTLNPATGFDVTTDVVGIYTAKNNMAYYGADAADGSHDVNSNELMLEAVQDADPDVDFSQYDNDGDGSVDGVYIVYAGYGQATSGIANTIWPHAGGIAGKTFDGKTVSKYSCSNELTYNSNLAIKDITTIGVICHEFGHVCGAPDYYDTDYETGGQFTGTGDWDVMCYGVYNGSPSGSQPAHMNPYEKVRAGWITPEPISGTTSLTIPDITSHNDKAIYIYNTNASTTDEYYMLENRQQTGFNTSCPGHGLMIYHYSKNYWDANRNKTAPQGFYPVCASATVSPSTSSDDSSYGDISSAGCPFPGSSNKSAFYDTGTPSSKWWNGNSTGLPLTNIKENADGTISLNATLLTSCSSQPATQASALTVTPVAYNSMNLSWVRGTGDKVIIVAREGSAVDFDPLNGTTYTANANFKSGDEVGSGNYVIYNGTGTSVSLTGLDGGTTYYFSVYEYNTADICYLEPALTGIATTNCIIDPSTFTENFERSSFGCWTATDNTGQGNWKIGTTSNVNYTPALSGNYAYFSSEYGVAHNYNADLISSTYDLSSYANVVLKYKHLFDASNSYSSTGTVSYSIDNGATWTQLATYTSDSPSNSQTVTLPVNAAIGKSQVKFKWNYTCSPTGAYMWAVDEIQVTDNSDYWTGATSTDWFDTGNWSTGAIPTSTTSAVISSVPANKPHIDAAGAACMNLTIQSGSSLTMNSTTAYTLSVSGDWTNNGTFTAGTGTVTFNGTNALQTIAGSSTTTFNVLTVAKGALSNVLEATSLIALSGTTNPLVLTSGTFKLSSASVIKPFSTSASIGTSSVQAGLWNNGGTITAGAFGWTINYGLLRISAGTVNVGTSSGNSITYMNSGSLIIEGGVLNVAGRISPNSGTSIGSYTQTGGTVNLNTIGSSSTTRAIFEINSVVPFILSGGIITIQNASSNTAADVIIASTTSTITGGTLQIGNANTTGSPVIRINSSVPIYNLKVNTPTSGITTASLLSNLTVLNNIEVQSNAKLQVAPSKQLTLNGSFINNAGNSGFVIQSDATGTATFLDNGSTNSAVAATVQQYLPSVRNWYMSSPVTGATAPTGNAYYNYVEAGNNGTTWTPVSSGSTFANMTGYVVQPTTATTFTYTGTLNTGAQSITPLTSTATAKTGYNLVGNPYPSYVSWDAATKANLGTSIWYRTYTGSAYSFNTYNSAGSIGSPATTTGIIAPMQAFWVLVNAGTTGTLAFDNTMRSHLTASSNLFRAPAVSTQNVLRLQVSNGTNSDEAVIYFNVNATDGYDVYDSPKMTNGNTSIPEIYTFAGTEKAVINGLNSIATNSIVPLSFLTGAANTFSIKATEVTNFDADTRIVLKDKVLNVEQDITNGTPYTFTSDATSTENRFAIIFKSASAITGIDNPAENTNLRVSKNADNQIVITRSVGSQPGIVTVCNAIGQKLLNTTINGETTVISKSFSPGVYFVTVDNITKKVIIN